MVSQDKGSQDREVGGLNIDQYTTAPLQMTKTLELPADPQEVFATLTAHAEMPEWFPGMSAAGVDNAHAEREGGAGAVRVCTFGSEVLTEDIVLTDAPERFAYKIRDGNFMGLREHFALVTLEPSAGGTLLRWRQFFHHPDPEAFNVQGGAMLEGALENLRAKYTDV